MKKFFQKTIKENVLATNQDHKKDLRYFYNLRVKNNRQKNKIENSKNELSYTKAFEKDIEKNLLRLLPEKIQRQVSRQKIKITKILTNIKKQNCNQMKNPLTKLNRKLRRGIFTWTPKFLAMLMILSTVFSFSFGANVAYAAAMDTTAPTVSKTGSNVTLKSGSSSGVNTVTATDSGGTSTLYAKRQGYGSLMLRTPANLTNLVITGGTVSGFTFSGSTYLYSDVTTDAGSVTVTPTLSGGTITVNGNSVSSGSASGSISVSSTTSSITIVVQKSGYVDTTYVLRITQAASLPKYNGSTATVNGTTIIDNGSGNYTYKWTGSGTVTTTNGTYTNGFSTAGLSFGSASSPALSNAKLLLVGGGGGGSGNNGGGGNGGIKSESTVNISANTTYTVTVGSPGAWTSYNTSVNGGASSFGGLGTANGGATGIGSYTEPGGGNGCGSGGQAYNVGTRAGAAACSVSSPFTGTYSPGGQGGYASNGPTATQPSTYGAGGQGYATGSAPSYGSNAWAQPGMSGVVMLNFNLTTTKTPVTAMPTFSNSGLGSSTTTTTISAASDGTSSAATTIYYTTDGTDPTSSGTRVTISGSSGSVSSHGAILIRAVGYNATYGYSTETKIGYVDDFATLTTARNAFTIQSGAVSGTGYSATVPASNTINDGTYDVVAVDAAGNQSSNSVSGWLTIDNTAPTISVVTPVSTPTTDNTPNYVFTTNEAGTISYGGSCSSATTSATVGSNTITFNTLADGTYSNCTITVTDAVGNASSALSVASFLIDTTAPTISSTAPATSASIKTPTVSYTLSEDVASATVAFTRTGGTADASSHSCTLQGTALSSGAHSSLTLASGANACISAFTALVDGAIYSVAFNATDAAGNAATTVTNTSVTYDTTAPVISSVVPTSSSSINSATVSYTLSEAVASGLITFARTGGTADASTHICTLQGTALSSGAHTNLVLAIGSNGCQSTFNSFVNGSIYTATFQATDAAGNAATAVVRTSVTFDNVAPTISSTAPATSAYVRDAKVSYTLPETVASGSVTWTRTSGTADPSSPHVQALTGTELNTGAHSNITLTNNPTLVDGTVYSVSFNATDAAGNAATTVTNTSVLYDTTAPTLSSVTLASNNSNTSYAKVGNTVTVSFTASETITTPTVSFTSGGGAITNSVTVSNPSGNNWTATYTTASGDTAGSIAYSISGYTDTAGNAGSTVTTGTGSVTFDKTAPTISSTAPATSAYIKTPTVSYTLSEDVSSATIAFTRTGGTADAPSHSCTLQGTALNTGAHSSLTLTSGANACTSAFTALVDGAIYSVSFDATDAAGNAATTVTNTSVLYDVTGPTITLSSASTSPLNSAFSVTATLSESVSDFVIGDLTITNGTASAFSGSGTTYTFTVTPTTDGVVNVDVAGGVANDAAGNGNSAATQLSRTYDGINPVSVITAICSTGTNGCTPSGVSASPQQAYSVQSIAGTASDTGGSGVSSVEISILDSTTNRYYTGSTFTSVSQIYLPATGTNTWSYNTSSVPFSTGDRYIVNVRSNDVSGNIETAVALTFDVTNSPPTVSNVTASESSSGVVTVGYDVTDIESSQTTNYLFYGVGATLNGALTTGSSSVTVSSGTYFPNSGTIFIDDGADGVNEIISYTSKSGNVLSGLTRGASSTSSLAHNSGVSVYIKAGSATGNVGILENIGTSKSITWTARDDADGYQNATENIIVVANDGSAGAMLGRSTNSSTFNLDAAKTTGDSSSLLINNSDGTSGAVISSSSSITLKLQNITGAPSGENIKVQFSRDGSTWFGANANGTLSADSTSTSIASDITTISGLSWSWTMLSRSETIQVKITDLYNNSSVVDSNAVSYNSTPEFDTSFGTDGISVSQVSDSNDPNFGKVKIDYKIRDTDNTTVTPTFSYDASGGSSFTTINNNEVTGIDTSITSSYVQHTVYWTPTAESISSSIINFKISLDDGELYSNTAYKTLSPVTIDANKPVVSTAVTFDAGSAGVTNSGTITIPKPTDDSAVQYRIVDDSITQDKLAVRDTDWVDLASSTTLPWTFDSDVEVKTIKYQFRDFYGNTVDLTSTSTPSPVAANTFTIQDISNIPTSYYGMYVGWNDTNEIGNYKIEHATSADNSTYGSYSDVDTSSGIVSDNTGNYHFLDLGLNSSLYYRYRLGVIGANGNTSVRAGAYVTAKPDGVQNFSEGGGGTAANASKVENVVPVQDVDKSVVVTYKLTDSSIAQKTDPNYEARVFYNIGITLPSNALSSTNLTVSDASKLKSSGYIQINNEVLKYTGKTGNVLTGIVRATWPGDVRTTRQNTILFAGTPVWVMAVNTTPTAIVNSSISTGQNESLTWNTYYDTNLAGSTYSNVGVRVLIHDNQAGTAGPLSTQNDYSENGILDSLDLSAPSVAFQSTNSSDLQSVSNASFTVVLDRAYPVNSTVHYVVTGTAVGGGVDYSGLSSSGDLTFTAEETSKSLSATIIDHQNQRTNKTIIITLSSPTNATLGANNIHTYTIINSTSDITGPTITLNGSSTTHVLSGTTYVDEDATVSDDIDGSCIAGSIASTPVDNCKYSSVSTVNTSVPGTYSVIYDAKDTSGNSAVQVVRTVIVDDASAVTYSITMTQSSGGTIAPVGNTASNNVVTVVTGNNQEFSITPNSGYKVDSITINSDLPLAGISGVNSYTFTNVTSNKTITASYSAISDTTKPTISIIGSNPYPATVGDTYTDPGATASDTYLGVTTDLTSEIVTNGVPPSPLVLGTHKVTYVVTDAAGNTQTAVRTINVTYNDTYTITTSAGNHGTITATSSVNTGENKTIIMTPDSGYQIATVTVDGLGVAPTSPYTFTNVVADHSISVTFSSIADVTAPVITLTGGTVSITKGDAYSEPGFTVVDAVDGTCTLGSTSSAASTGTCAYSIVNPVNVDVTGTYTIVYSAIDSSNNHSSKTRTVNVNAPSGYNITVTQASNGSITPAGDSNGYVNVAHNGSQQFTFTPDAGFTVDTIIVDGVHIKPTVFDQNDASIALHTISSVVATHTVTASFIAADDNIPPVITITQYNGSDDITLVKDSLNTYVDLGATAIDQPGSVDLTANIVTTGADAVNTHVVGDYNVRYNVSDAHLNPAVEKIRVVHVVYSDTYNITVTYGSHGTITTDTGTINGQGVNSVASHSSPTYTITPDDGFKVATIVIDSASQSLLPADGVNTYQFSDVISNHSIHATFTSATGPSPVITLDGADPFEMDTMTTFVEPGVHASITDADGNVTDLTSEIVTTGTENVNNKQYGSTGNKITYTVTDPTTGSTATVDRTVTIRDVTLPVISGIATPATTSTAVGIVWRTDELTDGFITYGTVSGTLTSTSLTDSTFATSHFISLVNLLPNTTYYYVIHSRDSAGNEAVSSEQTVQTVDSTQVVSVNVITGVLQSVYDALLKEKQDIENKIKEQVTELPVISKLKISDITSFSANIAFDSDKDTIGAVDYGKDESYGKNAADFAFSKSHKIKLTGLTMGTDYYFRVKAIDKFGNVGSLSDKTQVFKTKFFSENLPERTSIDNIEQFQSEVDSTIESILPSLIAPFITKPIISDITEDSAIVTFKTNIKSYPVVSYSSDSYYSGITDDTVSRYNGEISDTTAKSMSHTLQIIGLKPNTKYHVMSKAFSLPQVVGKSEDVVFTTKPAKIVASVAERKKDSFTIVWNTSEPTSSIIDYKNNRTGNTDRSMDVSMNTSHSMKIENLSPGTTYTVNVSGVNDLGNIVEAVEPLSVTTSTDVTPPVISRIKVDSALVLGRTDKTQTIISWKTDEPSTSAVYYEEGSGSPDKALANKQEDTELTLTHTVMLTTLRPGQVYRFQIASSDDANNKAILPVRTIITPRPNESIVDVIFKNFNETFNFINNVK